MRRTVILDHDLVAEIQACARERRISFDAALNIALRVGLSKEDEPPPGYPVASQSLGARPGIDLDKGLRLAAELEDAETIRKLDRT